MKISLAILWLIVWLATNRCIDRARINQKQVSFFAKRLTVSSDREVCLLKLWMLLTWPCVLFGMLVSRACGKEFSSRKDTT